MLMTPHNYLLQIQIELHTNIFFITFAIFFLVYVVYITSDII